MAKIKILVMLSLCGMAWLNVKAQQTKTVFGVAAQKTLETKEFVYKPTGKIANLSLSIENIVAKLVIKGTSRNDILLKAEDLYALPEKAKGLRSVTSQGQDNTGLTLMIKQDGNQVKLLGTSLKRTWKATFTIEVPAAMDLSVNYEEWRASGLKITEVDGDIEVRSTAANVLLEDVSGPISVSSTSGDIEVKMGTIDRSAPSILSSFSGDIDLALPESAKVSLQLKGSMGELYTDLDVKFRKVEKAAFNQQEEKLPKATKTSSVTGYTYTGQPNKSMTADLNGGGSKLEIHTTSGNVYLRKR